MKKKLFTVLAVIISVFIFISCKDKEKNLSEHNTAAAENESKDDKPERIELNNPEILAHGDEQDWVVAIAVPKDILENVREYDAMMVGTYVEHFFEKEEKIKWDISKDQRLIWFDGIHGFYGAPQEYGKVGLDSTAEAIRDKVPETGYGERIPLIVQEYSGKTCIELYYEYIKPLNVRTEFYGYSDEDVEKQIYDRYPNGDVPEKYTDRPVGIWIFVSRKKFDDMLLNGCPEDMIISLSWPYEFYAEIFDKIY